MTLTSSESKKWTLFVTIIKALNCSCCEVKVLSAVLNPNVLFTQCSPF